MERRVEPCDGGRRTGWAVYDRHTGEVIGVWIACCAEAARAKAIRWATLEGCWPGSGLPDDGIDGLRAIERHPLA